MTGTGLIFNATIKWGVITLQEIEIGAGKF
jgi:hypothetical protein